MKKLSITLILLIALASMMTFSSCQKTDIKKIQFYEYVFGTETTRQMPLNATLYGKDSQTLNKAKAEIIYTLKGMNTELNTVDENSVIYEFNQYGTNQDEPFDPKKRFYVSEHVYHMLTTAKNLYENDSGNIDGLEFNANEYFNPAIYPLMELWKLDSLSLRDDDLDNDNERDSVPTTEQITDTLPIIDFKLVKFGKDTDDKYYITKDQRDVKIDFGGQAKGYGTDLAVEICKKYNLSAAIINISGNVYVYKSKPISNEQVTKWTVGIDMPIESKDKFCALKLDDISIVTSGDYNRFFIYDGTKYAHILNPKTGYPLNIIRNHQTPEGENPDKYYEEGLISVTIINKNSELADIYAKIVMLLGMENGVKYMIQNNLSGVLISNDMRYAAVGELEQMDINGANGYKEYEPYVDNNGVEYSF